MFCKKVVVKNFAKFTEKHLCQNLAFNKAAVRPQACNFIKKEPLVQLISCGFCEIFKNTFFYRTPAGVASLDNKICAIITSHNEITPLQRMS